jgi:hypothetical protein
VKLRRLATWPHEMFLIRVPIGEFWHELRAHRLGNVKFDIANAGWSDHESARNQRACGRTPRPGVAIIATRGLKQYHEQIFIISNILAGLRGARRVLDPAQPCFAEICPSELEPLRLSPRVCKRQIFSGLRFSATAPSINRLPLA